MRPALLSLGQIAKPSFRVLISALTWSFVALGVSSWATAEETRCSYQECGLRIENQRLLQGARGEEVGRLGVFYNDLRVLEIGTDSAGRYAIEYKRDNKAALLWSLTGLALVGAGNLLLQINDDKHSWTPVYLTASGAAFTIVGGNKLRNARNALARSVWWYNAPLQTGDYLPRPGQLPPLNPPHFGTGGAILGGLAGVGVGLAMSADQSEIPEGLTETAAYTVTGVFAGWLVGRAIKR
jgi:hypothetical protein